jgi:D-alanyl-D-alanine carboxypeptidase/D-alanyl-D-alanine-endopeptidase (penicillin-binding protein 4)
VTSTVQADRRRRARSTPAPVPFAAVVAALLALAVVGSCSQAVPAHTTPPGIVDASTSPSVAGPSAGSPAAASAGPAAVLPAGSSAAPGSVLAGLPTGAAAVPPGVAAALAPDLDATALGPDPGVVVLDPRTGGLLVGADATVGATPASTAKLLTATAVLDRWGPAHRFTTRVLDEGSGATGTAGGSVERLVLVGGGDPSLTAATGALTEAAGDSAVDPVADPARLATLVAQTVAAEKAAGHRSVSVTVADGLFDGPSTSPDWRSTYVAGGFVGPVDALSLDGGRAGPDTTSRVADPALTAGTAFAAALEAAGIRVVGAVSRATAAGRQVAAVASPRLVDLVRHMLLASDNDYAETLLRQVAAGSGHPVDLPADFTGSTAAVLARLQGLGVATAGVHLDDGSGLSRDDRIPPLVLARVLAADLRDPALAGVPRSLPVAGRSGTLVDRFTGAAAIGRGRIVAKTGTLTGVDDLAGYVMSRSAGPLVVVVMADDTTDADAAESAIDLLASRLVRCGCHR